MRAHGGNRSFRASRWNAGNFSWASEGYEHKTRTIDAVYDASTNELICTKTLVKTFIIVIDAALFRQWYENHYLPPLAKKRELRLVKGCVGQEVQQAPAEE